MTDIKTMSKKGLALRVQSLECMLSDHLNCLDQITSMVLILRDSLETLDELHTYNQRQMLSNINSTLLDQFCNMAEILESTRKDSQ